MGLDFDFTKRDKLSLIASVPEFSGIKFHWEAPKFCLYIMASLVTLFQSSEGLTEMSQ